MTWALQRGASIGSPNMGDETIGIEAWKLQFGVGES